MRYVFNVIASDGRQIDVYRPIKIQKSYPLREILICFIPRVSPFYIVEKVKRGVLKTKVYFQFLDLQRIKTCLSLIIF